jgi:oxidase EvaA
MSERKHLDWFRERLALSAPKEAIDPQPILDWRDERQSAIHFVATLIPLDEVRDWNRDDGGSISHKSGQFFGITGVRIEAGSMREVRGWDQPIYTQPDGGILAMIARETPQDGVQFLLQGRAEPGNIGPIQLAPSLQCTWSNIRRAHQGASPPLSELLSMEKRVLTIYSAQHNEEGGRFWRKSNSNMVLFIEDPEMLDGQLESFRWASQSQIKELGLIDNVLSPFVKTIMAPL